MALAGRGRGAEAVTELGYYQSVFEGLGSWLFGIEYESFRDTDCGGAQRLKKKVASLGRGFYGNPGEDAVWGQQRFPDTGQARGQKWSPK